LLFTYFYFLIYLINYYLKTITLAISSVPVCLQLELVPQQWHPGSISIRQDAIGVRLLCNS